MQHPVLLRQAGWADRLSGRDRLVIAGSLLAFVMFFIDPAVVHLVRQLDPNVRAVFSFITDLGKSGWILVLTATAFVACAALATRASRPRLKIGRHYAGQCAAFIFVSVGATGLAASLIKNSIGRARPRHFEELGSFDFMPFAFDSGHAAFPSGHATTTFALATALAVLWPRASVPLFTAAVWIGMSRFLTGAHYVSDVMAGAALGTFGTLWVRNRFCARGRLFRQGEGGPRLRCKRVAEWVRRRLPAAAPDLASRMIVRQPGASPALARQQAAAAAAPPRISRLPVDSAGIRYHGQGVSEYHAS